MTSTISNHYADPVMVENKTGYSSGLPGAIPATNKGGHNKDGGGIGRGSHARNLLRALNDLLPYVLRPIKSRRRIRWMRYGVRQEIFTFRMVWRSHYKRALVNKMKRLIGK
jgi:hypothetical protein